MNKPVQNRPDPAATAISTASANTERMREWARWSDSRSRCSISSLLVKLYRVRSLRRVVRSACSRLEGPPGAPAALGRFFSQTWRDVLLKYHGVQVGKYSYGPCLVGGALPPGTCVGNYCSMAQGISVYRVDHPIDRLSQHPFFFNKALRLVSDDLFPPLESNPLIIGHDVWIGQGVIVLPKCRTIGNGAIIGAGSIVTRDVPEFAVVAGAPAKVIRHRFERAIEEKVRSSGWWLRSLSELADCVPAFFEPVSHYILDRVGECLQDGR